MLILFAFSYSHQTMLSPLPAAFSRVLASYTKKDSSAILSQVKQQLQKHSISFSSISAQGNDVDVQLADDTQVVFSSGKNISEQIDSLQVTIDHLTIEGKRISRVDLRFDRPVVTFK